MLRSVCLLAALGLALACPEVAAGAPPAVAAELSTAQAPAQPLPAATVCGSQARPAAQPPANSGPVVLFIAPCFEAQGNQSLIEAQTYLYYIQLKQSRPSEGVWIPYSDASE